MDEATKQHLEEMFAHPVLIAAQDEEGSLLVQIAPVFDDPGVWGVILADLAQHVANAYGERGHPPASTLRKIQQVAMMEFNNPTAQAHQVRLDDAAS